MIKKLKPETVTRRLEDLHRRRWEAYDVFTGELRELQTRCPHKWRKVRDGDLGTAPGTYTVCTTCGMRRQANRAMQGGRWPR